MGNEQGRHYLLSLHSGNKINKYDWTELPMPNEVIEKVHQLAATAEKYEGILLTDVNGNILTDQLGNSKRIKAIT